MKTSRKIRKDENEKFCGHFFFWMAAILLPALLVMTSICSVRMLGLPFFEAFEFQWEPDTVSAPGVASMMTFITIC